jgi:peptidoglycan-associated lipoprotein
MIRKMTALPPAFWASAALIALAGCAKTPKAEDLPPPPVQQSDQGMSMTNNSPQPGSQEHFRAAVQSDRIYFDTDQSDVDATDRAVLDSQAAYLRQYPQVRVTIEGHADERGTREYNLALGERRANAAKNYLASLGIDAARISVLSYGKERPEATGSDEAAWAQNRRAVTVTVQ